MLAERLNKEWIERRASVPLKAVMSFTPEGLVLGAGTILAPAGTDGRPAIQFDGDEARLAALLSAAHLRPLRPGTLNHIRKATERWVEGDHGLAQVHLALSGVDEASVKLKAGRYYTLFSSALLAILVHWPCAWAMASGFKVKLKHVPEGPTIRVVTESSHRLTWLAYLSAERATGLQPPAGVTMERSSDGGLLMIAASHLPDPRNAEELRRADALTAIMAERGLNPGL